MTGVLVNIDVDDLEKGVRFYSEALGLVVGRRLGGSVVEMTGGSSPIYLLAKAAGSAAAISTPQVCDYRRHWTPVHLDFEVEDIDAAVRRAELAGARLEQAVSTAKWGKLALMADPFGHGFCLIQFIGRGYDEIAG